MSIVAVVAHKKKTLGGGLEKLREALSAAGITEPLWYEFDKSSEAPRYVKKCVKKGAELILAWGGDGTVQSCIDALAKADAGAKVALAILPAGTANLLAKNLDIPIDITKAVDVALHGGRRKLDIGRINGEHFAVMAGVGFDAMMIRDANQGLKDRLGKVGYVLTGIKNLRHKSVQTRIDVDGKAWFGGHSSCVLIGNVGKILGGVEVFPDAEPTDGLLDLGVVEAESGWEWLQVFARIAVGSPEKSPLVSIGRGQKIKIELDKKRPYQLDGCDRAPTRRLRIKAKAHAITVCVPAPTAST